MVLRNLLLLLCLLASCQRGNDSGSAAGLSFERMKYNTLGLSVYSVIVRDSTDAVIDIDTLGLFYSSAILRSSNQYLMQWRPLKTAASQLCLADNEYNCSVTGIIQNDTQLYIHPPREGKFKILEFCPHPRFIKRDTVGAMWDWTLEIGSQWSAGPYNVKSIEDTFYIFYTLQGQEPLTTPWGSINCYKVEATSNSVFGQSHSRFYVDKDKGLIKAVFIPVNKSSYEFNLISVTADRHVIGMNKGFLFHEGRAKSSRGIDSGLFNLSGGANDTTISVL